MKGAVAVSAPRGGETSQHECLHPRLLVAAIYTYLGGLLLALTSLQSFEPRLLSVGVGALLVPVVLGSTCWGVLRRLATSLEGVVAGLLVAWIALSMTWTLGAREYVMGQAALAVAMAVVAITMRAWPELLGPPLVALYVTVLTLVVWTAVAQPDQFALGGRARGPFDNPNSLALVLLFLTPAVCARAGRFGAWPVFLSLALIWQTGSRTALLGMCVVVVVFILGTRRPWVILLSVIATAAAAVAWVPDLMSQAAQYGAGDASILRSNNSRSMVWEQSQFIVDREPLRGQGISSYTSEFESGSSYYALLIQLGFVGLALTLLLVAVIAWRAKTLLDWRVATIAGAAVAGAFEGWILAPGSFFCAAFWATLFTLKATSRTPG